MNIPLPGYVANIGRADDERKMRTPALVQLVKKVASAFDQTGYDADRDLPNVVYKKEQF